MAKNKTISQTDIIEAYMDYMLMHNEQPKTVHAFAKSINIEEQRFYEFFISFDILEQSIFKIFFDNAHATLEKSKDYIRLDSRNKLLSFYFTFFEILTVNRSYVIYSLAKHKNSLKNHRMLSYLKSRFFNYIEHLNIQTIDFKQEQLLKLQLRDLKESAWYQLLMTIKFWVDDTSPSFKKTTIFIEKSVRAGLNTFDSIPINNVSDTINYLHDTKMQVS